LPENAEELSEAARERRAGSALCAPGPGACARIVLSRRVLDGALQLAIAITLLLIVLETGRPSRCCW